MRAGRSDTGKNFLVSLPEELVPVPRGSERVPPDPVRLRRGAMPVKIFLAGLQEKLYAFNEDLKAYGMKLNAFDEDLNT